MKAQKGGRDVTLPTPNPGARSGRVVSAKPRPPYPRKRDPVPIVRKLGMPGWVWKISSSTAVQTPDRQATCLGLDLLNHVAGRLRLKCDGTRAEIRFRLSAKWTSPFKSAGASVQSTTGSRGVRISDSNAGYTMFRDSVMSTGYPLHSPVSLSLPLPCVTVCHHISTGLYINVDIVEGVYISSRGGTTKNGYSKDFDSFFADFVAAIIKKILMQLHIF